MIVLGSSTAKNVQPGSDIQKGPARFSYLPGKQKTCIMDIILYLSKYIPREIEVNGKGYVFQIFINHAHYDIRFCYYSDEIYNSRKRDIPYFLYLVENISSQDELLHDLKWLRKQLKKDGILKGDYAKPGGYSRKLFNEWTNKKR